MKWFGHVLRSYDTLILQNRQCIMLYRIRYFTLCVKSVSLPHPWRVSSISIPYLQGMKQLLYHMLKGQQFKILEGEDSLRPWAQQLKRYIDCGVPLSMVSNGIKWKSKTNKCFINSQDQTPCEWLSYHDANRSHKSC